MYATIFIFQMFSYLWGHLKLNDMNEELYKILVKIKALADRGVGGEAENAKRFFDDILQQNGFTIRDFESFGQTESRFSRMVIPMSYEDMLFTQVAAHLELSVYELRKERKSSKGYTQIVRGKAEQIARFEMLYNIYVDAMKEEMEVTYTAFIARNRIYAPRKEGVPLDDREMTAIERKAVMRAMDMEKVNVQKRLK